MSSYPATLSYVTFVITIISFIITCLNLVALYADAISTIRSAPHEIHDILGNLRQEICEEREALRQQTRDMRAAMNKLDRNKKSRSSVVDSGPYGPLSLSDQTLSLHRETLRDLWRDFKRLERPFLVSNPIRAEKIHRGDYWAESDLDNEKVRQDVEQDGERSTADWSGYYQCDFSHRFIWWQSKKDVLNLADSVLRVMMRRMEREVGETRKIVRRIRIDSRTSQSSEEDSDSEAGGRRGGNGGGGGGGPRGPRSFTAAAYEIRKRRRKSSNPNTNANRNSARTLTRRSSSDDYDTPPPPAIGRSSSTRRQQQPQSNTAAPRRSSRRTTTTTVEASTSRPPAGRRGDGGDVTYEVLTPATPAADGGFRGRSSSTRRPSRTENGIRVIDVDVEPGREYRYDVGYDDERERAYDTGGRGRGR